MTIVPDKVLSVLSISFDAWFRRITGVKSDAHSYKTKNKYVASFWVETNILKQQRNQ